MDVQPVQYEIVRYLRDQRLGRIACTKRDDVAISAIVRSELEELQPPVVRSRGGRHRR